MRLVLLALAIMLVAVSSAYAVQLSDCAGVIRVFGDASSWMSSCFVVGDGSWVVTAADTVVEKVGPETDQTIRHPIFISAYTGQAFQCDLKAYDKELGVAILKLPVAGLPAAPLAQFSVFSKSKCAYGTMGQVMSGEPAGNRWLTDIYGITREQKPDGYRLTVFEWGAAKGIVTDIGKSKWLFVSDVNPDNPIPNGSMIARESSVVGMYINKIVIGYGRQNVAFGRCVISSEIAKFLSGHGIGSASLNDPPAPTIKHQEGADAAFQLRASIYSQIGALRPGVALEKARALVKLRPEDADAYLLLGTTQTGAGKFEEAVKSFDQAAELDPKLFTLRTNRALALIGLKRRDEAEAELVKAIGEAPDDARPVTALADFYLGDEKTFDKALTYASKAESMAPKSPAAKLLKARVEKRKKNYAAAITAIGEAVKMAPAWIEAWYALGSTYEEGGDKANAEKSYRKLVELQPKNPSSILTLASFLVDQGKKDEATELIAKLRELNPPQSVLDAAKELEDKTKGSPKAH